MLSALQGSFFSVILPWFCVLCVLVVLNLYCCILHIGRLAVFRYKYRAALDVTDINLCVLVLSHSCLYLSLLVGLLFILFQWFSSNFLFNMSFFLILSALISLFKTVLLETG